MKSGVKIRRYLKVVLERIFPPTREGIEHYDRVIAPEVLHDDFYESISKIAAREELRVILEIGSSSGEGSTQAIVDGIMARENSSSAVLHCMEISLPRFEALRAQYESLNFVKVHRLSSVGLSSFPSKSELRNFYKNIPSSLNHYTFDEIYSWMEKDIEYLRMNISELLKFEEVPNVDSGIDYIKNEFGINTFDFVLIDGGEFLGWAEFQVLYGSRVIALDDINSYKCRYAYDALRKDSQYRLIVENWITRNGWAIFEKI
jgi:hypothetical protein